MPVLESGEETLVGGQAIIEGVMMRTPHAYCVAVRKPDGSIQTEQVAMPRLSERYPIFRLPILRGVGSLGQAMWLGVKALRYSADVAVEAEAAAGKDSGASAAAQPGKIPGWAMALNLLFSFAFFVFLYKFVPLFLTSWLVKVVPAIQDRILFNLTDGAIRIAIFVGFLLLISRWRDIHQVFEYHGAEHKVVFNYESGQPLTVGNAQRFVTWHPRCGTSFLLVVMLISIVAYAALPFDSFAGKFLARVALIPVIAGVSFEMIRFAARHQAGLLAWFVAPGLWLQRITTQPPSDRQAEVAIRALEGAMEVEKQHGGELVIA